ncbi:MAG TPA: DUF4058 family protein [Gemmataceae bacterium]|jgi:hypothetical protein|nr:DUF4058 family protein [Gemmataceae bacterium]
MPILDHFHPPLSIRRNWDSFHTTWTVCLGDALTALLPETYLVEVQTQVGAAGEIDVATFEEGGPAKNGASGSGVAVMSPQTSVFPAPTMTMPVVFPEGFEVRIFSTKAGPRLVAALELISPGNKDRPESRRAFAAKCASYLYQGISLIIVDIVTERSANLHNETMRLMQAEQRFELPADVNLYAVAYRPVRREQKEEIDLWPVRFKIGDRLPTLPLILSWETSIQVDLEAAYLDACKRRRLL